MNVNDDNLVIQLQARSPNCLSLARVAPPTLKSYQKGLAGFLSFCQRNFPFLGSDCALDDALSEYGNALFRANSRRGNRQTFINAVMCVELYLPHLRKMLQRSRAVYGGWDKRVAAKSPPPFPLAIVCLIVFFFRDRQLAPMALAVLIGFHAMIRRGEVCLLTWNDIILPGDPRLMNFSSSSPVAGLLVRKAKGGLLQFVPLRDSHLISLLVQAKASKRPSSLVLTISADQFRSLLDIAVDHLGFGNVGYVAHSLRHGGATHYYMLQVPVPDIKMMGRWKCPKSLDRYVLAGRGLLLANTFSSTQQAHMHASLRRFGNLQAW